MFSKVSTEPNSSSSSRTYSLTYFLPWKNRHIFPSTCFDTELPSPSDGVTVMSQRHQLTLLKEESSVLKHVKVKLHVSLNIRILKNTLNLSWQRESRRTKIYFRFSATHLSLSVLLVQLQQARFKFEAFTLMEELYSCRRRSGVAVKYMVVVQGRAGRPQLERQTVSN